MIIWTVRSDLEIATQKEVIRLRPGSHNYQGIDHKDPRVAEQLRVMRKHGGVGFSELLDNDVEVLKKLPQGATVDEKKAALKAANLPKNQRADLKPKPKPKKKPAKEKVRSAGNSGRPKSDGAKSGKSGD